MPPHGQHQGIRFPFMQAHSQGRGIPLTQEQQQAVLAQFFAMGFRHPSPQFQAQPMGPRGPPPPYNGGRDSGYFHERPHGEDMTNVKQGTNPFPNKHLFFESVV